MNDFVAGAVSLLLRLVVIAMGLVLFASLLVAAIWLGAPDRTTGDAVGDGCGPTHRLQHGLSVYAAVVCWPPRQ